MQEHYFAEWNTTHFKSYGAVMKGYVLVPENMLKDLDSLATFVNASYDYVMTLEPK